MLLLLSPSVLSFTPSRTHRAPACARPRCAPRRQRRRRTYVYLAADDNSVLLIQNKGGGICARGRGYARTASVTSYALVRTACTKSGIGYWVATTTCVPCVYLSLGL